MIRKTFTAALVFACLGFAAWAVAQPAEPAQSVGTQITPTQAPAEESLEDLFPELLTPTPAERNGCFEMDCTTSSECRSACPSAVTAVCNQVTCSCDFTFGPGPGPGGGSCPASDCNDDSDCENACPSSSNAYCGFDGICRY